MRTSYNAGLTFLLLLCMTAGIAHAQDEAQKRRLMQFAANNQAFDRTIEQEARALYNRQIDTCKTVDQAVRQLPTPYGALNFPDDPHSAFPPPHSGIWAEHVKIRGCDRIWQVNMLAVSRYETVPMLFALLPGDTLADPASQRSAERIGAMTIKKADATCADDARTTYTRILGYRQADGAVGKQDAGNGWFEEWTYKFCQKLIPVQIAFIPDGKGGYDIKARIPGVTPKVPESKPGPAAQDKPAQTGDKAPGATGSPPL